MFLAHSGLDYINKHAAGTINIDMRLARFLE